MQTRDLFFHMARQTEDRGQERRNAPVKHREIEREGEREREREGGEGGMRREKAKAQDREMHG